MREVSDPAQVRIDQFIENDQREQLSVRDMIAFVAGQVAAGMSIADLARATGRDRARLSRLHGLASAPDFIAARLDDLPVRGAVALMKAVGRNEAGVKEFLERAPIGSLTVASCETFARGVAVPSSGAGDANRLSLVPVISEPLVSRAGGERQERSASISRDDADGARFIEVDGRRGRLIEALVHFDGEDQARTVRFGS